MKLSELLTCIAEAREIDEADAILLRTLAETVQGGTADLRVLVDQHDADVLDVARVKVIPGSIWLIGVDPD